MRDKHFFYAHICALTSCAKNDIHIFLEHFMHRFYIVGATIFCVQPL